MRCKRRTIGAGAALSLALIVAFGSAGALAQSHSKGGGRFSAAFTGRRGGAGRSSFPGAPPADPGSSSHPQEGTGTRGHGGDFLPEYAAWYGIIPGDYGAHFAPSTASVTRLGPHGVKVVSAVPPGSFPPPVQQAMEDLHRTPAASRRMRAGTTLFRQRRYGDAADEFRRAIPLDPDNSLPRFAQALVLFALGDYEGSSYHLRRGFDLTPDWIASGSDLRGLYGSRDDFQDQKMALQSYLKQHPRDGEALAVLAYIDFFSGDEEGAKSAATRLSELRPDDPLGPFFRDEMERSAGNSEHH